jgi:hypothetical protein
MKKFLVGLIIGMMLMGAVFADTQTIEAFYNNIKISIDGKAIELKNATGSPVEPFIYNGTTYLPVRAIAEALGMEVKFNETTNTVELAKVKEVQELENLRELSPEATASILEQNPEVRETIDENGYAIWKGRPVRLNKDYLDGKVEIELMSEAKEQTTVDIFDKDINAWDFVDEGEIKVTQYKDGRKFIMPYEIYNVSKIVSNYSVDKESKTLTLYGKYKEVFLSNIPLISIDRGGVEYVIPYDDYKNNILPKLIDAVKQNQ